MNFDKFGDVNLKCCLCYTAFLLLKFWCRQRSNCTSEVVFSDQRCSTCLESKALTLFEFFVSGMRGRV